MEEIFEGQNVRFTASGKEVRNKVNIRKATNYGLAKALMYYDLDVDGISAVKRALLNRWGGMIDQYFYSARRSEKKPTKEEREYYADRLQTFKVIFGTNLDLFIKKAVQAEGNGDTEFIYKAQDAESKTTNNAIFDLRVQRSLMYLTSSPGIDNVVDDYRAVIAARQDPSKFPALEVICKSALWRFMNLRRISYIPWEDQLQEGKLAIWHASESYKALNFARFSTMAKVSLENKFKNIIRAHIADKRRVHKYTKPAGSATGSSESFLARLIDQRSHKSWQQVQAHQLNSSGRPDYNPFVDPAVILSQPVNREEELFSVFADCYGYPGIEEVTSETFPHMNERNITFVHKSELEFGREDMARNEFWRKMNAGEYYRDDKGIYQLKNPSPLLLWWIGEHDSRVRREAKEFAQRKETEGQAGEEANRLEKDRLPF